MFCIKCFHTRTNVVNSRPHKKQPSVWRRRQCPRCQTVFTTRERPVLADSSPVSLPEGAEEAFNLGKLTISIWSAFSHQPAERAYDALWLAESVEEQLSTEYKIITPDDIAAVTHQTLKRFDELAAVQYAAKHHLITAIRRRGRPSLSPRAHEPPTDESPSR